MADMPPVTTYPAALLDAAERDYRAHHLVESGPHAGRCAACGRHWPCQRHSDSWTVLVTAGRCLPAKPGAPGISFRSCDG